MTHEPDVQDDKDPNSGSSLVPMLVWGLGLTVVGLLVVVVLL